MIEDPAAVADRLLDADTRSLPSDLRLRLLIKLAAGHQVMLNLDIDCSRDPVIDIREGDVVYGCGFRGDFTWVPGAFVRLGSEAKLGVGAQPERRPVEVTGLIMPMRGGE